MINVLLLTNEKLGASISAGEPRTTLQETVFFSVKAGELHNGATYGPGAARPFKRSNKDRPLEPPLAKIWNQNIKVLVQSHWAFKVSFRVCRKLTFTSLD